VSVPVARDLRRRTAADSVLRLFVRIPSRTWISAVSVVCCPVEVSVRRADYLPRGVQPNVVCLSVIWIPQD